MQRITSEPLWEFNNHKMAPVLFNSPEKCCACRACSNACPNGAITFQEDRFGFWFPTIDESLCINCGRCRSVCIFQNDEVDFRQTPIKGYAATLSDKTLIKNSTSGGVFMAMAEWVLSKGGYVFGCVWDENMNAKHVCAESMEQVLPMQGSKYVQSNVGNIYVEVKRKLQDGRHVLFSGTPCQVAALKSYLGGKEYENLITLDLICHGVPNNKFFHQFLSVLEKKYKGKVTDFHFRHKKPDWQHSCVWMEIKRGKKRLYRELSYIESLYSTLYSGKNQCSRQSCSQCKYACNKRVGDMTIGDFWGYKKLDISFDYKDGLSCILVNHSKVLPIISQLKLITQEVPIEAIIDGNNHLRRPSIMDEKWGYVMETFAQSGFDMLVKEYEKKNVRIIKAKIRRMLPQQLLSILFKS